MASRLRYPELAPDGYRALSAFGHYVNTATALEPVLLGLVYLRASVLNGCRFCIEMHKTELRKHHEPESRIEAVVQAPQSDAFTPREQAALRWTEVVTRLQGQEIAEVDYAAVNRYFEGKDLVDLTFAIANINAWNRMGVAFQPEWRPRAHGRAEAEKAEKQPGPTEAANGRVEVEQRPATAVGGEETGEAEAAPESGGSGKAETKGSPAEAGTAAPSDDDGGKVGED